MCLTYLCRKVKSRQYPHIKRISHVTGVEFPLLVCTVGDESFTQSFASYNGINSRFSKGSLTSSS